MRRWDAQEAHVAGRVGLAVAVQEWTPALLAVVQARARHAREVLDGVAAGRSWSRSTSRPASRRSPAATRVATRAALLERGLLVSAVPVAALADLTGRCCACPRRLGRADADLDALARAPWSGVGRFGA